MHNRMRDYAKIIDELMEKLRLNQAELAEQIGVSQGTVSRWKNGTPPEGPSQDKIDRFIKEKFGAPVLEGPIFDPSSGWMLDLIHKTAQVTLEAFEIELPDAELFEVLLNMINTLLKPPADAERLPPLIADQIRAELQAALPRLRPNAELHRDKA